jgi:hypothetical protein
MIKAVGGSPLTAIGLAFKVAKADEWPAPRKLRRNDVESVA